MQVRLAYIRGYLVQKCQRRSIIILLFYYSNGVCVGVTWDGLETTVMNVWPTPDVFMEIAPSLGSATVNLVGEDCIVTKVRLGRIFYSH